MSTIEKAVSICGGTAQLAEKLGVTQAVVCNWLARDSVPPEKCIPIELATSGAVTRYDLRPGIFGAAPAKLAGRPLRAKAA